MYEVQEWNEHRQQNINPSLTGNLRSSGRECFRHANEADGPANSGEQKRQKGEGHEMKRRPLRKEIAQDEKRAEYESQAVEKMSGCSGGPDFVRIDASNQNLAIGEFQKSVEIGFDVRKRQALRQKYN